MRIAIYHNLPSGGAKRAVYEWVRRLARTHYVDVFTLTSADHTFCDVRPFVNRHVEFEFVAKPLFESPLGRLNQVQRWRDVGRLARLNKAIAGEIDAQQYDAVLVNPCRFTAIPAVLQFLRSPAIYFLHEPVGRAAATGASSTATGASGYRARLDALDPLIGLYRRRLDVLQAQSLASPARLLANSAFTQRSMRSAYDVDSSLCRYGVDADVFRPLSGVARDGHVLSVGEMSPRKGFTFVVEAIGRIPLSRRPALRIASNSVIQAEREHVERVAAERGVRLEIMVGLGNDQLTREYNRAALCVYAPLNEPFGLVPLEAMACGTPVVGVREGGVPESVIHEVTGTLVPRDAEAFAGAVQRLLSEPTMLVDYGRNGREHVVRNWTWDASVTALEEYCMVTVGASVGHGVDMPVQLHRGSHEPRHR